MKKIHQEINKQDNKCKKCVLQNYSNEGSGLGSIISPGWPLKGDFLVSFKVAVPNLHATGTGQ